ncbi:hypothetical protein K1719_027227 [Acacia pycnantha]|nr:hypothetical protein K1719_027227 [Acacia pycnantha]
MDILSFITVFASILVLSLQASMAVNSILKTDFSVSDGMALVSKGGTFKLGFFRPGNSKKHYLGIWYQNIPVQTVVWVANRINPINDSSAASLTLDNTGRLVLIQNDTVLWNSTLQKQVQNPVAELLDSGNLVVRDEGEANQEEAYLWQSFDYPSDKVLAGMKLGCDLRNGLNRRITAWKSPEDPSPGDFSFALELNKYPEFYMKKGDKKYYRTGPWNGLHPSGEPEIKPNSLFYFNFVSNKDEVYYMYQLRNPSVITRAVMNQTDYKRYRYVWGEADKSWKLLIGKPSDYCDDYGLFGPNGKCVITESPVCQCLKGFTPMSPQNWNSGEWSDGCVRNKPLNCSEKHIDGFIKLEGLKVPDTTQTWLDESMNLKQCREKCLDDCSCLAYTNSDIRGAGSGCVLWFGDLIDIRGFPGGGQDLYVRLVASELELKYEGGSGRKLIIIVATSVSVTAISGLLLVACCFYIHKFNRNKNEESKHVLDENSEGQEDDLDLPLFDMSTIVIATDNFSVNKKVGEGGFGPVYKGIINGQEIAVKKLSRSSVQGTFEFKNEVKLIAKLQHRNLVKLLGCCIHGQEKMLVYEFMPNGSLDSFIFDNNKSKVLNWSQRFQIMCGIARGLLYLHQDSRLRIIHRDLKISNVLLDNKLNPKISDFGMARIFGTDQIEGNTNRIVGTYDYMAPEYASDGQYSEKSDVFSFGILLLEIIAGKRNRFYHADHTYNLISIAWKLWKEGKGLELIDKNIENDASITSEVLRCIHISLLCVQQHPEDRPTMSSVVLMLGSEIELGAPEQPGFFVKRIPIEAFSSSTQTESGSTNEITISQLEAR